MFVNYDPTINIFSWLTAAGSSYLGNCKDAHNTPPGWNTPYAQNYNNHQISKILKRNLRLNVSNAAVRSVDKKGSFDLFLKDVKSKNLSSRLKKIKKTILAKSA